ASHGPDLPGWRQGPDRCRPAVPVLSSADGREGVLHPQGHRLGIARLRPYRPGGGGRVRAPAPPRDVGPELQGGHQAPRSPDELAVTASTPAEPIPDYVYTTH